MTIFPLVGRGYRYNGRDERKQQKTHEKNKFVAAAARFANQQIANDPHEIQQIIFETIAHNLGCDADIVRHALGDGGYNGRTFRVTDEDRRYLACYKILPNEP